MLATQFAFVTIISLTLGAVAPGSQAGENDPSSCGSLVAGPQAPIAAAKDSAATSRLRQYGHWLVGTGVACTIVGGGSYACHVVVEDPTLRAGFFGAILTLAFQMTGTELRRFVAPQLNWAGQWLDRLGYSVNNFLVNRFRGKKHTRSALGDLHSPDIAPELLGRLTAQQRLTADRIEGLSDDFDWLGNMLVPMIRSRRYEDAASQFVATASRLAYTNEEVLQRTVAPHPEPMVRDLLMMGFRGYFVDKLATLAKEDATHIPQFERAVQRVLMAYQSEFPTSFMQYRTGIAIVVDDWMKELVGRLCAHEWCVVVPGRSSTDVPSRR